MTSFVEDLELPAPSFVWPDREPRSVVGGALMHEVCSELAYLWESRGDVDGYLYWWSYRLVYAGLLDDGPERVAYELWKGTQVAVREGRVVPV